MVNIVTNGQPSSVTFNVDSGEISPVVHVQDSLVKLANEIGIVDAMQEINEESYNNDQDLRDDYDMESESIYQRNEEDEFNDQPQEEEYYQEDQPQQQKPKKKSPPKKTKGDKRYDDLIYKLGSKAQEAEEIARQRDATARELKQARDEHAAYVLSIEKQRIASDIDRVSDIMVRAKETDQSKSYVDGNRIMNELILKEAQTDAAINQLAQQREQDSYVPETSEYERLAEEKFYDLSDAKEISSPAYAEWLKENSYYNPYDGDNYDEDLAQDVHEIKRTFNKFLKHNRNGQFIGTPDYYQELDAIVQNKLYGDFVPQQQKGYSNRGYSNQREDNDMKQINYSIDPDYQQSLGNAMPEGQSRVRGTYPDDPNYQAPRGQQQRQPQQQRPGVAPVNRSGYNQQYSNMPPLSEQERKLALMWPAWDTNGRPLSDQEKLQSYAANRVNVPNNGRR
jgi:hypothetical protein